MHARVTTGQVNPDQIDEAMRVYRNDLLPTIQRGQGFKGVTVMADRATGKTLAVSLWESEAAMMAAEADYQAALTKLAPFAVGQGSRQNYEVLVQG